MANVASQQLSSALDKAKAFQELKAHVTPQCADGAAAARIQPVRAVMICDSRTRSTCKHMFNIKLQVTPDRQTWKLCGLAWNLDFQGNFAVLNVMTGPSDNQVESFPAARVRLSSGMLTGLLGTPLLPCPTATRANLSLVC